MTFDAFAQDITDFYTANLGMEAVHSQALTLGLATEFGDGGTPKDMRMVDAGELQVTFGRGLQAGIDTSPLLVDEYVLGVKTFGSTFADVFRYGWIS
jgi:hypothetical protein